MKLFYRSIIYLPFIVLLFSCEEKTGPTVTIEGSISPIVGTTIILKKESDIEKNILEVIETIEVTQDGKFKKEFTLDPHLYRLQFDDKKYVPLAINNGQHLVINITGLDKRNFKTTIKGSKDSERLLAYETFRKKSLDTLVQSVRRQVRAIRKSDDPDLEKIKMLEQQEIKNYETHLDELNDFIKHNMANSIGLYATSIRWRGAENLSFYDSLTQAFENEHPNLEITVKLREKVTRLKQTSIGGIAPDIEMNTPEGKAIKLSSVQKKYTLIDFWASWCGPCRSESEMLNELYNKYSNKGFEIYSVSLDDKNDKWLKAIEKDQRTWPNVSSLEGFKTPASYDYAVTALPDNYLIDKDRKIVAKNIHGDELANLINELLGK